MFSNIRKEESEFVRLVVAVAGAALGMTLLLGLEIAAREGIRLAQVGGYLSWPWWVCGGCLWAMLGAGAVLPLLISAFAHGEQGLLTFVLQVLLPALPGGVGAQIMSGGSRGTT